MNDVPFSDPSDHDLLIELRTELKGMRSDIKEMKDDTKATIADHETRLRFLERYAWGAIAILGATELYLNFINK